MSWTSTFFNYRGEKPAQNRQKSDSLLKEQESRASEKEKVEKESWILKSIIIADLLLR